MAVAIEELQKGDGVYYIAQEISFAPGIVKEWPDIIPHPDNRMGWLVKRIFPKEKK